MSKEFITYFTQPFNAAVEQHMAPKPTDVEVFVILGKQPDGTFSLDDLERVVLSARASKLNDDFAEFTGVITEPPEIAGREATLTVQWGVDAEILGKLLVERL